MRRQENQPPRPTAGCFSVPIFNQKKRNRVPLTSAPSENDFFSHTESMASTSSGTYGCYQTSGLSSDAGQSFQRCRQGIPQSTQSKHYGSNSPAPGPVPTVKMYAPMHHPYKAGSANSKMGLPTNLVRQQDSSVISSQTKYQAPCSSRSAPRNPAPHSGFARMGQQSSYRMSNPTTYFSQQSTPQTSLTPPSRPSAGAVQPQNNYWKFTNSFESQKSTFEGKKGSSQPQTARRAQTQQETIPLKLASENSLRILTAVIDGMRHWSQFKDKVPFLFEIFATLDSAVTLGHHGAKSFLIRDGKEVVQCVFYENDHELPRLIRGQVHRCVGNYDQSRDVLVCVSVRPGLPSELRNAQEAVKVCDAEMRALVRSFSEV